MDLEWTSISDCHTKQHKAEICVVEQGSGLHCLWGRGGAPQGSQAGDSDWYVH